MRKIQLPLCERFNDSTTRMPIEFELQINETFPAHKKRKQKGIKKKQRKKEKEMNGPKLVLENKGNPKP